MTSTDTTAEHIIPFRSRAKLREDNTIVPSEYDKFKIPNWKRAKQNEFAIHHIHGANTWMADYFFFNPLGKVVEDEVNKDEEERSSKKRNLITVLALMHCNSRLFLGFIVKSRESFAFRTLLEQLFLTSNDTEDYIGFGRPRIDILITDYERAFGLDVRKNKYGEYEIIRDGSGRNLDMAVLYKNRRIEHISYNTSADKGAHSKLAPIDRMARTLRDMIFNVRRKNPKFKLDEITLTQLCKRYNFSSHGGLSRIMGFPVSPFKAYTSKVLQNEICRRIMEQNYSTAKRILDSNIPDKKEVWVYQPPIFGKKRRNNVEDDPYEVIEYLGPAGFRVRNKNTSAVKTRTRMNLVIA